MGFQDRYYYREQSDRYNPLLWLLGASVQVLSVAGTRVRLHISLILFVGLALLMGISDEFTMPHRLVSMAALVVCLVLHELAHCFATRALGGFADEALLWPLGGLADWQYPHRPGLAFVSVAAGPALNLAIAAAAAGVLFGVYRVEVPFSPHASLLAPGDWSQAQFYLWYLYIVSYLLLLVNLLPVLPLDGAHLLQTLLWPTLGYGKSLLVTCNIGIGSAVVIGGYGIYSSEWILIFAMIACMAFCVQKRSAIKAAGVWTFDDYDTDIRRPRRRHRLSRYTKWRTRRQIRREEAERIHVDAILEKIQRQGINSLTWWERRVLRRATERQRQREMEIGS